MKKVLALLAVAALVGVLISTGDEKTAVGGEESTPAPSRNRAAKSPAPENSNNATQAPNTHQSTEPAQAASTHESGKETQEKTTDDQKTKSRKTSPEPAQETSNDPSETGKDTPKKQSSETGAQVWLEKARQLVEDKEWLKARDILTDKYLNSKGKEREAYQELLDRINRKLIWDPDCMKGAETYRLQSGDTLGKVARKYDINWRMIARLNGIENPGRIRAGDDLKILTGKPRILVTKSEYTLTLLIDDYYVKEYPVGIGKNDKTPTGEFTIDNCLVEPDWYKPSGGVVEYGEEGHLLGDRWMGFEDKPGVTGFGIHGTNEPDSVGTKCSQGCVRLRNKDVRELYDFVTPGTRVKIVE